MKCCAQCDPRQHEGGCNWLDWMVEEAGGTCPHCGGAVTDIDTVTPLGRFLDGESSIGFAAHFAMRRPKR